MARNVATEESIYAASEPYFKALKLVLSQHDVFEKDYAIGRCAEESACIIYGGTNWEVFFFEKGQKRDSKYFERVDEACIQIIELVGKESEREAMKREFQLHISKTIPSII